MDTELLDRLRREREHAWERASLYARHADRLEKVLCTIQLCPCCAETATQTLRKINRRFESEWSHFKEEECQSAAA